MPMRFSRTSPLVLLLAALLWAAPVLPQSDESQDDETAEPPPAARIQAGDEAPDFALPDLDGEVHRLSDLRGKPLVLVFFRGAW